MFENYVLSCRKDGPFSAYVVTILVKKVDLVLFLLYGWDIVRMDQFGQFFC